MVWAQGKGPATYLVFYVSAIKIDANGYHASRCHHIIWASCKYGINKIPKTSYVNATLKKWGHDFTRNGGGGIQTLEPMGKIQMSKGKPIKLSTTHFVLCAQSSKSG